MATRSFPALGFDPAPGEPAVLEATAGTSRRVAELLGSCAGRLSAARSSTWTGAAADAFRGTLADLPGDLDTAARAHRDTASALTEYASGLGDRQRRAAPLEARAEELRRRQAAAVAEVNQLAARRAPAGSPELAALTSRYDAARRRADSLGGELAEVLGQARELLAGHRAAAGAAARRVRTAADAPYEEPGRLSRAWDSVQGWIAENAGVLRTISTALKAGSAVLGVLSLVPGFQFLAPVAIAAGGIALLVDGALCLAGRGDWSSLALDAALTVLPVGRVAGLLRRVPGVGRAATAAGRAIVGRGLAPGSIRLGRMLSFTDDAGRVGTRGTRATAHLDPAMLPAPGTRAAHRRIPASIRPAGYQGAAGPHAKGHLLADTLGGPHDDPANFVTLFHGAGPRINNGPMADFEMQVRRVVTGGEPGVAAQNVVYRSVARGRGPLPDSVDLLAIGERGWWHQVRLPNR